MSDAAQVQRRAVVPKKARTFGWLAGSFSWLAAGVALVFGSDPRTMNHQDLATDCRPTKIRRTVPRLTTTANSQLKRLHMSVDLALPEVSQVLQDLFRELPAGVPTCRDGLRAVYLQMLPPEVLLRILAFVPDRAPLGRHYFNGYVIGPLSLLREQQSLQIEESAGRRSQSRNAASSLPRVFDASLASSIVDSGHSSPSSSGDAMQVGLGRLRLPPIVPDGGNFQSSTHEQPLQLGSLGLAGLGASQVRNPGPSWPSFPLLSAARPATLLGIGPGLRMGNDRVLPPPPPPPRLGDSDVMVGQLGSNSSMTLSSHPRLTSGSVTSRSGFPRSSPCPDADEDGQNHILYSDYARKVLTTSDYVRQVYGYFRRDPLRTVHIIQTKLLFRGHAGSIPNVVPKKLKAIGLVRMSVSSLSLEIVNHLSSNLRSLCLAKLLPSGVSFSPALLSYMLNKFVNLKSLVLEGFVDPPESSLSLDFVRKVSLDSMISRLQLNSCGVTDEMCQVLLRSPCIRSLSLSNNYVTSAGLRVVSGNTVLNRIGLNGNALVKDTGAHYLSQCRSLRTVHLRNCGVTEWGLYFLLHNLGLRRIIIGRMRFLHVKVPNYQLVAPHAPIASLETINLTRTFIPLRTLDLLSKFGRLSYVCLSSCRLTDAHVERLVSIPSVTRLCLSANPQLGLKSINLITANTRLEELFYSYNELTDVMAARLMRMPFLRELHISFSAVTDRALRLVLFPDLDRCIRDGFSVEVPHLFAGLFRSLRLLNIYRTKISPEGIAFLQTATRLNTLVYGRRPTRELSFRVGC